MNKKEESLSIYTIAKSLAQGQFLSRVNQIKNFPFLVYISFWALLVVHLSNSADKKVYTTSMLQEEVNDLTIRSTSIKSQLMYETKYSSIRIKANKLGLYQDKDPPILIIYNE